MYKHKNEFEVAQHNYATRYSDLYLVPFPYLSKYKRSLKSVGPTLWNKLDRQVKLSANISIFKTKLKKSLLSDTNI